MAHNIALTHHERWDGTGYPQGLCDIEIPIEGRIVAVCDVFDALTSDRPYKTAWSIESAADEIRRLNGKHFCPAVVDAFEAVLNELLVVRLSAPDRRWTHFRSTMQPSPMMDVEVYIPEEA
jgi:putative two-component system response regulator